ncbi:NAD(+) diphosphatase [Spartinivicinus ruber]|uniref:NAD(+) diphosphatase n=1 Tax=Spartinivicinus ruber TaxID=2683272 RepID=UPI001E374B87|nr:NAD(+) diphosphatase [Spartinivicinus ruber]
MFANLMDELAYQPIWYADDLPSADRYLLFYQQKLVVSESQHWLWHEDKLPVQHAAVPLARYQEQTLFLATLRSEKEITSDQLVSLRQAMLAATTRERQLLGYAGHLVGWMEQHRYCGRCARPLQWHPVERAKQCECGAPPLYPAISPCIIVLITRGNQLLLARSPRFPEGVYSTIAGFIEPGETIEHGVMREVAEEVGVVIKNLQYKGSQPWPFPHSLMIGFHAEHDSGEIVVDGEEIEAADWFTLDDLPLLPSSISISRWLIDDYIKNTLG